MTTVVGQQDVSTSVSEYNALVFVVQMLLQKLQTVTLVKVIDCTNDGGVSPVGTVTVQPLVNLMSGNRQPTPHGNIFNVPYFRVQGGANAVIIDPQAGDIGICAFASRDISAVKSAKGPANPGSFRMFDWADGLYFGGFLNGDPTQYIAFAEAGITAVSPTKITLQAPTVEIIASSELNVQSPDSEFSGNITAQGTITGVTEVVAGSGGSEVHMLTHEHPTAAPGAPSPPTPGT